MGLHVTIEGVGETLMSRKLERFAANLAVPVSALEAAAVLLRASTERQFDTEGGNSGGWPELAASTIRARGDDGHPILQVTGALKESLTRKFDSRHIEEIGPSGNSLRFGSTVPYGIYHQSTAPRTRLPRRPPIALSAADRVAIVKGMQAAIIGALRGEHVAL